MFKVLTEGFQPTKGTKYSACVDLYSSEDVVIGAGETKIVGLGVAIDIDWNHLIRVSYDEQFNPTDEQKEFFLKNHYLQLMLRSSLGKKGLILPNGVGIIDLDYKDEIKMIIHNPIKRACFGVNEVGKYDFESDVWQEYEIKKGDKIAQIMLCEHKSYLFGIETETERNGGFGSSGA